MAGINQGTPETAIGEPIHLGSNDEYEIEQHPISDRLIIRDTENGKVAYIRQERGGNIGGDGVLIESLKEGRPMADDGRTYSTIQEAERAASSWVFVPPGTYNEQVEITTSNLTLKGCGYNTYIYAEVLENSAISSSELGVTVTDVRVRTQRQGSGDGGAVALDLAGDYSTVKNVVVEDSGGFAGIRVHNNAIVYNCRIIDSAARGIDTLNHSIVVASIVHNSGTSDEQFRDGITVGAGSMIADCICWGNSSEDGLQVFGDNSIIIGSQVANITADGVQSNKVAAILANNRVSDVGGSEIVDNGSQTLIDGNLTGSRN